MNMLTSGRFNPHQTPWPGEKLQGFHVDAIFFSYMCEDITAQDAPAQLAHSPDSQDRRYGEKDWHPQSSEEMLMFLAVEYPNFQERLAELVAGLQTLPGSESQSCYSIWITVTTVHTADKHANHVPTKLVHELDDKIRYSPKRLDPASLRSSSLAPLVSRWTHFQ
jgi:hypothetical protein